MSGLWIPEWIEEVGVRAVMRRGQQKFITGSNPAVGVGEESGGVIVATVPANFAWVTLRANVSLASGVGGGERFVQIGYDDAITVRDAWMPGSTTAQAGSTQAKYMWDLGIQAPTAAFGTTPSIRSYGPLFHAVLFGAYNTRLWNEGGSASDDLNTPTFVIWEFPYAKGGS
jgi:hypothetical protein